MKRMLTLTAIAFSIMLGASFSNKAAAQPGPDEPEVSYQTFYDELEPYGRWMDYPDYGYVWVPDCGPDFRPYNTNGHWVWSDDYEWMWVSDYDWGWAPFHYGRWLEDPYYGWIWVPGYEWSPAWVAWRDGGDYYGWAPLRPGISISINFSLGSYNPPVDYWCFAPRQYITSPRIYDYCVPRRNNITIINNTTIINNYNYNRNVFRTGPGRRDVERYTGRISPVRFRDTNRPGRTGFRNNEVSMFRPRVDRDNNRQFAPRRFEQYDRSRSNSFGRNNNLPQPRDGRSFGNRDNDRRFGNGNDIADRRRTDNRNNDGSFGERNRPFDRRQLQQPGNSDNNRPGRRNVFDRNDDRNSDGSFGERNRPFQRREMQQPSTPDNQRGQRNVFDRNNNRIGDGGAGGRNRSFERRDVQQPSSPGDGRRMERQQFPQAQPQQRQDQPRQFERRDNNGGGGNRSWDGGGHGRRGR